MAQPGLHRGEFPAGERNREWDPSEDWYQESNVPGVGVSLHLPVACTYMIYMQKTEKGARRTRRCSGIALGPFTHDITARCSRWRGFVLVCSWGSGRCTYCRVWGAWTQKSEESHVCWSGKRARVHPGSTQSGASLPETFPQGSGPHYSFIFPILQPDLLVQEYSPQTQAALSPGKLTLRFQGLGPKLPAGRGLWGQTVSSCRGTCPTFCPS